MIRLRILSRKKLRNFNEVMYKKKIHLVQKTEHIDVNEISVYHDLIVDKGARTRCLKLGIKSYKIYKNRPKKCPYCNFKVVIGLQVLGAYNKVLLWVCDRCDKLCLRFPKRETEELLKGGEGYWTNSSDWDAYLQEMD